jgi:hypothetical protein
VESCALFDSASKRAQKKLAVLAAIIAVIGIVTKIIGLDWLIFAEFIVSAGIVAVIANYTFTMTYEGTMVDANACVLYADFLAADKICAIDSQTQFNLLLFAFQFDLDRMYIDKIDCPSDDVVMFFAPSVGKGGRREAAFIQKFAMDLEKRSS